MGRAFTHKRSRLKSTVTLLRIAAPEIDFPGLDEYKTCCGDQTAGITVN